MRILVAGAGVAGLLAAREAARLGGNVTVAYTGPKPGWPPHCTGVVSRETAERIGRAYKEALQAEYKEAHFLNANLKLEATIRVDAVKLDRPKLDELLAEEAEAHGAKLVKLKVQQPQPLRGYDHAIIAVGASAWTSQKQLLPPGARKCTQLLGLEATAKLAEPIDPNTMITIHGTPLAPTFYAWIAPIDEKTAAIGLATPPSKAANLKKNLEKLTKQLTAAHIAVVKETITLRGGTILRGPPAPKPTANKATWIGDTLCTSKPYTGGGIYAATILAKPVAQNALANPKPLRETWKRLHKELKLQHIAARIASKHPNLLLKALKHAQKRNCNIHYDKHTTLLKCLLKP